MRLTPERIEKAAADNQTPGEKGEKNCIKTELDEIKESSRRFGTKRFLGLWQNVEATRQQAGRKGGFLFPLDDGYV